MAITMHTLTRDVLLGAAAGDAFGVPYEFLFREQIANMPLERMIGCDDDNVPGSRWGGMIPAGAWSDDTSMSVAVMEAISDSDGIIDYDAIMHAFERWWNDGAYASISFPFGLGGTVSAAMQRYQGGRADPLACGGRGVRDNGNGALMRAFPFALYGIAHQYDANAMARLMSDSSSITHGHDISKMSCFIFAEFLRICAEERDPHQALAHICSLDYSRWFSRKAVKTLARATSPAIAHLTRDDIRESGYVVDTLEGALHGIFVGHRGNGFADTILESVRIGYDTDTTACVAGAIAGALYGADSMPDQWMEALKKKDYLEEVAARFATAIENRGSQTR